MQKFEWFIYIPDEGDWPIGYSGSDKQKARQTYLKVTNRKSLPRGSKIWKRKSSLGYDEAEAASWFFTLCDMTGKVNPIIDQLKEAKTWAEFSQIIQDFFILSGEIDFPYREVRTTVEYWGKEFNGKKNEKVIKLWFEDKTKHNFSIGENDG